MANVRKHPLDKWIREVISDPDKPAFVNISLVHKQGSGDIELHSWKKGGTAIPDAEQLAKVFYGKAEAYCQEMPGVHTFNLLAFYAGSQEPLARQPFLVNVSGDNSGLSTEGPNESGQIMQRMRHREMEQQQVYRKQQHLDEYTLRLLELSERNRSALVQENMDAFSIIKEMMMKEALDAHNRAMEKLKFERSTEERKKWLSFAPVLINTILGEEVFPQSTEDTVLVETIANSLDETMISKLMGIGLPNELMGPLAIRVQKAQEKKRLHDEATKALPMYRGNPEDDVTGGTH